MIAGALQCRALFNIQIDIALQNDGTAKKGASVKPDFTSTFFGTSIDGRLDCIRIHRSSIRLRAVGAHITDGCRLCRDAATRDQHYDTNHPQKT